MVVRYLLPYALLLLLVVLAPVSATLSKSDRKVKQKPTPLKPVQKKNFEKESLNLEYVIQLDELTVEDVLEKNDQICADEKTFKNAILGYVTPWNNRGYDIAKWAAKKFTHISPVWFQFKPEEDKKNKKKCVITGLHDMDQGWLSDIRSNNSEIAIVPRFLMDSWSEDEIHDFLHDEMWQMRCAKKIVDFLRRNKMQGAVIEIWVQVLAVTQGQAVNELLELLEQWSNLFHQGDLEIIVPVPPALVDLERLSGFITNKHFNELAKHVDHINVMLYDYRTSANFEAVAPYEWIIRNLQYFLSESPVSATKIMLGVNFYGYEVDSGKLNAISAKRYLELLSSNRSKFKWNSNTKEHAITSKNGIVKCIYPSTSSLKVRFGLAEHMYLGIGIWDIGQGLDYFTCLL